MSGPFQVAHNYYELPVQVAWGGYTIGPLHGDGWLAAVGFARVCQQTRGFRYSFSLVQTPDWSVEAHTAGTNLLGPGGNPLAVLGDWHVRYMDQMTDLRSWAETFPMWVWLDGGAHWVSIALHSTHASYRIHTYGWAAVVAKSFVTGLVGAALPKVGPVAGMRR